MILVAEVVGSRFRGSREGLRTEPFAGGDGQFLRFLLDTMASHDPLMPGLCGFQCGDAAAAADPE